LFVETVDVVDFLQVELEFVVIGDGDIRSHKRALVVIESLSEGRQVFDSVLPFRVVRFL
jgi:hypothetical protein